MQCEQCGLPMSLADGAHIEAPYWTCDGPNDNTDQRGCGNTQAAKWEDDSIQFPRLIAEMEAAGFFEDDAKMENLCVSMDLDFTEVMELVDRAQTRWDQIKEHT